jgi:NADH dehydrogenase [ubiquinone] 1 alpha subcomplex assembly factor 7
MDSPIETDGFTTTDAGLLTPPPKTLILPRADFTHVTSESAFLDTQHAVDLYDPGIHSDVAGEQYEAATPLWSQVLLPLLSVMGRPMTVADYMSLALTHPEFGYYMNAPDDFDTDEYNDTNDDSATTKNVIGADFVTAPEVSEVFGQCLGIWFATQWQLLPAGQQWQWLECGPGKGSLMADLLNFAKVLPQFEQCVNVHFVEASPVMKQQQKEKLQHSVTGVHFVFHETRQDMATSDDSVGTKKGIHVYWHDSYAAFQYWNNQSTKKLATYCVLQEFLDALPIYSFQKTEEGVWRERLISLPSHEEADHPVDGEKIPRLCIVLAPEVTPALKTLLPIDEQGHLSIDGDAPTGSIIEVNPQAILLAQDIAKLCSQQGGAALIIDYGQEGSTDSIRSFKKHKQVPFLSQPGQADITADVDFAALRHAVNSLQGTSHRASGPKTQGDFLMAMGLQEQVMRVIEDEKTSEVECENLYQAMVRLASPEEMGERYKVLCITGKQDFYDMPPPGF